MGYTGVIVFGDSLVDSGNALGLANWYNGLPFTEPVDAAPTAAKGYYSGRFTNGFNFADLISNKYLGVPTKPVFPYGYEDPFVGVPISPFASDPSGHNLNFAYGGAQMRRGGEKVPDIDGQTDAWRDAVDGDADPNALHLFAFGANDVHDLVPKTGAWASLSSAQAALTKAADKFIHEILQTIDDGVNHVLVLGVPDIGIQPYYNGLTDEAARRAIATQYSQMLDDLIQVRIAALTLPSDVEFKYVSFTGMASQVLDVLDDLFPASQVYPLNQSSLVFFDKAHPTAQLNALATAYLVDQLNGTVSGDVLPLKSADYTLNGGIGVKGEVDTIVLSLAANTTYTLNMLGLSSLAGNVSMLEDPLLKVVGPSGTLIGSNDDGGAGLDASFTFTSGAAGDYIVQLTGVGSMTGTYRFQADGTAAGNTTYLVTHSSAIILERSGEGTDAVLTSVNYALQAESSIEQLRTSSDIGTANINLTGNSIVRSSATPATTSSTEKVARTHFGGWAATTYSSSAPLWARGMSTGFTTSTQSTIPSAWTMRSFVDCHSVHWPQERSLPGPSPHRLMTASSTILRTGSSTSIQTELVDWLRCSSRRSTPDSALRQPISLSYEATWFTGHRPNVRNGSKPDTSLT